MFSSLFMVKNENLLKFTICAKIYIFPTKRQAKKKILHILIANSIIKYNCMWIFWLVFCLKIYILAQMINLNNFFTNLLADWDVDTYLIYFISGQSEKVKTGQELKNKIKTNAKLEHDMLPHPMREERPKPSETLEEYLTPQNWRHKTYTCTQIQWVLKAEGDLINVSIQPTKKKCFTSLVNFASRLFSGVQEWDRMGPRP